MKLDKGNGVAEAVETANAKKKAKKGEAAEEKESKLCLKLVVCVLTLCRLYYSNPL